MPTQVRVAANKTSAEKRCQDGVWKNVLQDWVPSSEAWHAETTIAAEPCARKKIDN